MAKETPPLCLSPSELSRFLSLPRPRRCELILSLHHPNQLLSKFGRCPDSFLYSADIVVAATMCWLAWSYASREGGMFKSWKWMDAFSKMTNVIKSTLSGAKNGLQWGSVIFRNLLMEAGEVMHATDLEWWQANADMIDTSRLRQPEVYTQLLSAFRCLTENQSHIYAKLVEETEHSEIIPVIE